jgi:hypothetical protein
MRFLAISEDERRALVKGRVPYALLSGGFCRRVDVGDAAEDVDAFCPAVEASEAISDEEHVWSPFLYDAEKEVASPSKEDDVADDDLPRIDWCDRHGLIVLDEAAQRAAAWTNPHALPVAQRADRVRHPSHEEWDARRGLV